MLSWGGAKGCPYPLPHETAADKGARNASGLGEQKQKSEGKTGSFVGPEDPTGRVLGALPSPVALMRPRQVSRSCALTAEGLERGAPITWRCRPRPRGGGRALVGEMDSGQPRCWERGSRVQKPCERPPAGAPRDSTSARGPPPHPADAERQGPCGRAGHGGHRPGKTPPTPCFQSVTVVWGL